MSGRPGRLRRDAGALALPSVTGGWSLRRQGALGRLAVVLLVLLVWQLAAQTGLVDPLYVATPIAVAKAMVDLAGDGSTWVAFGQTGSELLTAFVVGTGVGLAFGALLGLSKTLRAAYVAPALFLLSVPKSVFVPVFVLLFGIGRTSASAFGAFSAFFYVVINLVGGVDLVEDRHRQVARAFAASRWETVTQVVVPASLPGVFAALWQGVKHAFGGVLIAELWASRGGIGQLIVLYTSNFKADHVLAITLVVAVVAVAAGSLWSRLEKRMDWRSREFARTGAAR